MLTSQTKTVEPVEFYPRLMRIKNEGAIVLFTSHRTSVAVHGSSVCAVGYSSTTWEMSFFEDFHGEVTLTQS